MVLHGPPDYFSTIVKQIYFCMVVACGGADIHKNLYFITSFYGPQNTK